MTDPEAMFRRPADLYDRFIGRYSPGLALAMREAVALRSGQRALDVGCGSGALTAALADVLGAENVAAVDPSAPFVEAARARVPGRVSRSGRPSPSRSRTASSTRPCRSWSSTS